MTNIFQALARSPRLTASVRSRYVRKASRIWRRLKGLSLVADVPDVGRMALDISDFIPSRLYFFGTWEPSISAAMREALRPGSYAIDIGANIGYYTLLMARAVGPQGRVLAFEPVPQFRAKIEDNIRRNQHGNVTVLPYGISDQPEKRAMTVLRDNSGASHFGDLADDGLELGELADFTEMDFLRRVGVIKIDVEGMEAKVLRSLLKIVDHLPADVSIFVEIRPSEEIMDILQSFAAHGFRMLLLENDYALERYARGGITPPRPIDALGEGQQDIVLMRGGLFAANG